MKKINVFIFLSFLLLISCNDDRQKLIIADLDKNGFDTTSIGGGTVTDTSSALGSQKIIITVVVDAAFTTPVTKILARAFTSKSPVVASTWVELTGSSGTFTGTYDFAPNPTQAFGIQVQAFNGTTKVADVAGLESEYTNAGDGTTTITGTTITLTTPL
ncbi:MAG: hypothetical protein COA79_01130 [Planctomycetota bacterium]|nr:MAG: hypothetical protein COA79_01130 [Planctomycetota bacterium]